MLRVIDCRTGGELDVDLADLVQGDVFYDEGGVYVRAFFSRERAEKAIKNMDRWGITSSYRVIKYKMNAE